MEAAEMIKNEKLDAFIFMLVHDSIVVQAADNCVERVKQILRECTQRDRGCSIPKCPVGIDQEVGQDYSFGKFDKKYNLANGAISLVEKEAKATQWVLDTEIDIGEDDE